MQSAYFSRSPQLVPWSAACVCPLWARGALQFSPLSSSAWALPSAWPVCCCTGHPLRSLAPSVCSSWPWWWALYHNTRAASSMWAPCSAASACCSAWCSSRPVPCTPGPAYSSGCWADSSYCCDVINIVAIALSTQPYWMPNWFQVFRARRQAPPRPLELRPVPRRPASVCRGRPRRSSVCRNVSAGWDDNQSPPKRRAKIYSMRISMYATTMRKMPTRIAGLIRRRCLFNV